MTNPEDAMQTTTALAPTLPRPALTTTAANPHRLVQMWLDGRSVCTREAYRGDLEDFRRFVQADSGEAAAAALLSRGAGAANELVLSYRDDMVGRRKLASASVNRRLAALRSLVDLANLLGTVEWSLGVPNVKQEARRDRSGPAEAGVHALVAELDGRTGKKGIRDRAIFRLLLDLALRRFEVTGLDVEHLDLPSSRVAVLRKGKKERRWLDLPPKTVAALSRWVEVRASLNCPEEIERRVVDGVEVRTVRHPLFTQLRRNVGQRLDGDGLARMVRALGDVAGVPCLSPHKIRHSSITALQKRAEAKGMGLRKVADFSGHSNTTTLEIYLDRDKSYQGELAAMVAEAF